MDERLEERVTEAVLQKLTAQAPAALCVGAWPAEDLGYAAMAQALGMASGTYAGSRAATRGEAASMLCRVLERGV